MEVQASGGMGKGRYGQADVKARGGEGAGGVGEGKGGEVRGGQGDVGKPRCGFLDSGWHWSK